MTLSCPRCDVALEPPPDDFSTRDVSRRCHRCHGAWVDGDVVGVAHPALREHGRRVADLLTLGAREREAKCPRCARIMLEFPFFDLWLDLCEGCHGLWIDGDERAFVSKAAAVEDGLPERPAEAGYRAHAQPEVEVERVTCTGCSQRVHPRRTLLTADGAVCDHCVEIDAMSRTLRDDTPAERLARLPSTLLRWFGTLLDLDGKLRQRGAPK